MIRDWNRPKYTLEFSIKIIHCFSRFWNFGKAQNRQLISTSHCIDHSSSAGAWRFQDSYLLLLFSVNQFSLLSSFSNLAWISLHGDWSQEKQNRRCPASHGPQRAQHDYSCILLVKASHKFQKRQIEFHVQTRMGSSCPIAHVYLCRQPTRINFVIIMIHVCTTRPSWFCRLILPYLFFQRIKR